MTTYRWRLYSLGCRGVVPRRKGVSMKAKRVQSAEAIIEGAVAEAMRVDTYMTPDQVGDCAKRVARFIVEQRREAEAERIYRKT